MTHCCPPEKHKEIKKDKMEKEEPKTSFWEELRRRLSAKEIVARKAGEIR